MNYSPKIHCEMPSQRRHWSVVLLKFCFSSLNRILSSWLYTKRSKENKWKTTVFTNEHLLCSFCVLAFDLRLFHLLYWYFFLGFLFSPVYTIFLIFFSTLFFLLISVRYELYAVRTVYTVRKKRRNGLHTPTTMF